MRYRRACIPGGSFFFTVVTEQRRPLFTSADTVGVLRAAFRAVRATHPFEVDAMVVLPDHLHCVWTLPPGDADFATRWRLIKTWFTKHSDPTLRIEPNRARTAKQEQAVWQRDGAVLIDMRRYRCAGIQAHLLEPGRIDLLSAFSKFMPDLQITIFTQTRPWLVVLAHSVSTEPLG